MSGELGVLNVGAGDIRLSFDPKNPAECIRAARIVKDMLRRGYALMIEVPDGKGGIRTERVREFREDTFEYVIADFDGAQAETEDKKERTDVAKEQGATEGKAAKAKRRPSVRAVPASGTRGVAVGPIAGG